MKDLKKIINQKIGFDADKMALNKYRSFARGILKEWGGVLITSY